MKGQPLTKKEFNHIYGKVPRLCADLLIKSRDGILLTKRDIPPCKGFWHFPGGTVRYQETLEKAVSRVAMEELGLRLKIEKTLGTMQFLKSNIYPIHTISVAFLCSIKNGKPRGSWQAREVRFFKTVPAKTIREHKEFIIKNGILKRS